MISCPAAKQIRCVKPSMATTSPSWTRAATASRIDVTLLISAHLWLICGLSAARHAAAKTSCHLPTRVARGDVRPGFRSSTGRNGCSSCPRSGHVLLRLAFGQISGLVGGHVLLRLAFGQISGLVGGHVLLRLAFGQISGLVGGHVLLRLAFGQISGLVGGHVLLRLAFGQISGLVGGHVLL